ncbi:MAG: aminotransferase class I/II-fold pyridoxal phosphate-dependent enzyme [candidate division WOR-3 bacterium]|nr:aminotransferase class I/II-fold pyridoxal phosphate-dependent enzyme [candidate division WOR-3 bacterium]MCX7947047.1 aminotransferase class I/II-fold pyridoxal phosphate-dependent enzyme [candidate division WOR-3 bacterium]MDW8149912.1 aminotransferase class I/II-fold pyridoxal phosphate-dependent enzyme [candidate division WOR-3 bacterium]
MGIDYKKKNNLKPETLILSYGYVPAWSEYALKPPIYQTSTFIFKSAEEGKKFFEIAYGLREKEPTESIGLIYSRLNNPNIEILEDRLTLYDEAEDSAVFSSGMSAISTTILTFLKPKDKIFYSFPLYGGTYYFFEHFLKDFDIEVIKFYISDKNIFERIKIEKPKIIYIETPANPTLEVIDMEKFSKISKEIGAILIVDNTFLGPIYQKPLRFGADLVVYSATKYISGHSDVVAGAVVGYSKYINQIKTTRTFLGTITDPINAWLILRSLETLKIRFEKQTQNAIKIANFLKNHPKVRKVYYLGLLEGEQYEIYKKQCLGPGAMISFDIDGDEKVAFKFLNNLKVFKLAVSLGGTESLAEHPYSMTHSDIENEEKLKIGISDSMIRLSIGIENVDDLINDLKQAFENL